jgi:thioesterase domain-containing protein
LFLVQPPGGHVLCYLDLARRLGADQPCYGLEAPGLHGETQPDRIESLAARFVELMRGVQPRGPYRLSGWSMGGLVAFEMARQLSQQGEAIAFLGLLDSGVPGSSRARPVDEVELLTRFLCEAVARPGEAPPVSVEELRPLPPDERLRRVLERARLAGTVPAGTEVAQVARLFDIVRTNLQALSVYDAEPYPGPVAVFRAREQLDPGWALGWERFGGSCTVFEVPGDHGSLLARPHVDVLAERIRECLEGALVAPVDM